MKRLIFNIGHWGQKNKTAHRNDVLSCREEATRTPDPHVPNVVRYQLRYFSNLFRKFSELLGISLFSWS